MVTVTWQLGQAALVGGLAIGIGLVAAALLVFRVKLNSAWLVLAVRWSGWRAT